MTSVPLPPSWDLSPLVLLGPFRASHSWPSQHLLTDHSCISECLLLSVTVSRVKMHSEIDTDIEINTGLVVRSRTHSDATHYIKHLVILIQFSCDTL